MEIVDVSMRGERRQVIRNGCAHCCTPHTAVSDQGRGAWKDASNKAKRGRTH